jgi:hypothetical protein
MILVSEGHGPASALDLGPKACDHRRAGALHGVVRADIQTGLLARRRHRLATVAARFLHTGSTRDPAKRLRAVAADRWRRVASPISSPMAEARRTQSADAASAHCSVLFGRERSDGVDLVRCQRDVAAARFALRCPTLVVSLRGTPRAVRARRESPLPRSGRMLRPRDGSGRTILDGRRVPDRSAADWWLPASVPFVNRRPCIAAPAGGLAATEGVAATVTRFAPSSGHPFSSSQSSSAWPVRASSRAASCSAWSAS